MTEPTENETSTGHVDDYPYPEPHPWPHPTNPTQMRQAPDGRIALCFTYRDKDYKPAIGWVVLDTPNGQLQLTVLTGGDVADWTPVKMP